MTSPNRSPFPSSSYGQLAQAESGHWWFRVRNMVVIWALTKKVKPFNNLLEVGCGTGYVLEGISRTWPKIELHGSEYFEEGLEYARKRVPTAELRQLDATTMDEIDRYDVVAAFDVIEHIEQDETVLRNLARAIRPGGSLVLTYGTTVYVAQVAAEETGIDAEVIDLRSLWPLDLDAIVTSVKKTRRCVVVHEATRTCGFGAELIALVQEHCFHYLEAPIERVTGWDTPYPHAQEWAYFPGPARVGAALQRVMEV